MYVQHFMSTKLVTVELDDRLETVKEIFERLKFHHLLVVDSEKLFGIISDRDLLKALSPNIGTLAETWKDAATLNKRVHQIVTRHPIVLNPGSDIYEAIDLFNTHAISCIPIVDSEFKPVGILSWRDIMKEIGTRKYAFFENAVPDNTWRELALNPAQKTEAIRLYSVQHGVEIAISERIIEEYIKQSKNHA